MNTKERQTWEEDVHTFFEEGMERMAEMTATQQPRARYKEKLITSYMSDIQELIALNPENAIEELNTIKFIVNNCH